MRLSPLVFLAPLALAAPAAPAGDDLAGRAGLSASLSARDNLCSLKAPPALCQPDPSVTVAQTAERAYKFYRAFVVDGDPKTMFSLIDSTYKVGCTASRPPETRKTDISISSSAATPRRLLRRPRRHLVALLQRPQDGQRGQHRLVLRRQHQHVLRAVLDRRPLALGGRLCARARTFPRVEIPEHQKANTDWLHSGIPTREFPRTSASSSARSPAFVLFCCVLFCFSSSPLDIGQIQNAIVSCSFLPPKQHSKPSRTGSCPPTTYESGRPFVQYRLFHHTISIHRPLLRFDAHAPFPWPGGGCCATAWYHMATYCA